VADCQPNVVVSFIDLTNMLVLASTFGLRVGKVISERIDPRFHFLDWRWRIVRRLLYPLADALVVQTQAVRQWASWVVLPRKLHVIPNAARALPAAAADSSPREPFVLGVGRLHRQKGFDLLLRAFSRSKLRASGWRLVILGDGPERGNLQELAAQLRVADLVSLPGVSDTPELFMARCGVFVLSSRFEGFPNVLVEAMACGAPVVSFNCPCGPAEIIGHGRNGLLVPAGNESLLTHALDTLLADEALRQRIGAAARQVIEEFSNDRVTTMWERLMTETARPTPATEKADVATDQG
jgi:glycosyltransferase involved in cell wall biosynthesis